MAFYDSITDFIFVDQEPEHADLIFVPGGSWGEIALRAAALYLQGYSDRILVSGKYSILQEGFAGPETPECYRGQIFETECDFLSRILMDEGVPESAILKEKHATYTYENAIRSRELTDRLGIYPDTAILCCQAYHARRSLLYYQLLYPDTRFLVCPAVTQNTCRDTWTQDPVTIDRVLGEVERCGSQFHEILKTPFLF
ncbi:MAG: YdcF family protein [Candidatus Limivivens sp.]|nr:YdcF family protein [Candidatus Limivivens sp.]